MLIYHTGQYMSRSKGHNVLYLSLSEQDVRAFCEIRHFTKNTVVLFFQYYRKLSFLYPTSGKLVMADLTSRNPTHVEGIWKTGQKRKKKIKYTKEVPIQNELSKSAADWFCMLQKLGFFPFLHSTSNQGSVTVQLCLDESENTNLLFLRLGRGGNLAREAVKDSFLFLEICLPGLPVLRFEVMFLLDL